MKNHLQGSKTDRATLCVDESPHVAFTNVYMVSG